MAQDININVIPQEYLPKFHVSQGDTGRDLIVHLRDGGGKYNVPTGATVKLVGTKPSGLGFTVTGTVDAQDKSKLTFTTTETMTNEFGHIRAEIRLETSNGLRIGTSDVLMVVERDPHPDDTTDGDAPQLINEITALLGLIRQQADRAENAAERAEDALSEFVEVHATANTLPAGSSATAHYSGGLLTLGIPRGNTGATGPRGPEGPEGPAGRDGHDGQNGRDGTDGQDGQDGQDGTTFTPSVSAEGVISWTNDGGKTNPPSVNIKGPQGDDYVLTLQDKTDIANIVIGILPVWNGGGY